MGTLFFVFSKILYFIITPIVWIVILLIFSLWTKNPKWKKISLIIGIVMLVFFTNTFIVDECMRIWEMPITKDETLKEKYDIGIVLGGGMVTNDIRNKRLIFRYNTDRIFQTIALYKTGRISKILISSGEGSLISKDNESLLLKEYLNKLNIPDSAIIIESKSNNTHQNAKYCYQLLKNNKKSSILLITSAYHMRRALACFKKEGLIVTPYTVDKYVGKRRYYINHLLIPNANCFIMWNILIHEISGYIIYYLIGYI
jgi:uncharacterized SAM-binding protein YcdF (DUF218 family)